MTTPQPLSIQVATGTTGKVTYAGLVDHFQLPPDHGKAMPCRLTASADTGFELFGGTARIPRSGRLRARRPRPVTVYPGQALRVYQRGSLAGTVTLELAEVDAG